MRIMTYSDDLNMIAACQPMTALRSKPRTLAADMFGHWIPWSVERRGHGVRLHTIARLLGNHTHCEGPFVRPRDVLQALLAGPGADLIVERD